MFISAHHKIYNWNRNRSIIFKLSLCITIASSWVIINYQTPLIEAVYNITEVDPMISPLVVIPRIPARTKPQKVNPPPKRKALTELIIPVDNIEETEQKEDKYKEVIIDTLLNDYIPDTMIVSNTTPAPIVEITEPIEEDDLLIFADQMPVFGKCDPYTLSKEESKKCSDMAILKYIHSNLKYPSLARANNIQGTVVLRFVIDKTGKVTNVKILRDLGGGCGKIAKNIITNMPEWLPGKQNGRFRNVQFTIPIKFDLK